MPSNYDLNLRPLGSITPQYEPKLKYEPTPIGGPYDLTFYIDSLVSTPKYYKDIELIFVL
jgi:hypothetical protein